MFKKNMLITLMILSCSNIHGILDSKKSPTAVNKQKENQTASSSEFYGKYTLANTILLTTLYGSTTYMVKDKQLKEQDAILHGILVVATLTTGTSIIVDLMNFYDHEIKQTRDHEIRILELQKELAQSSNSK